MDTLAHLRSWRRLPWLAVFVLLCTSQLALAQQAEPEVDPPERVGHLSYRQGSVVFAPEGDEEWVELPQNRPLTAGDRLWSDRGARAEVHLGPATLHVDGESHLGVSTLDDLNAQFILMQGTVNARVRDLAAGENFEIDTPQLAFRATQPGDYRVEVDLAGGHTRVVVHSGTATVFGEGGQTVSLGAGQQAAFAGRSLAPVQAAAWRPDGFTQWAAARNRAEDQSISARYLPRGVVGYQQLDGHGTWSQDPSHGAVWYPEVAAQEWAPYRNGRWSWVDPWGWTWLDDAPWGFAPFHYGRWATIGNRWAWVPGRMAPRPVYSPGLVAFVGGNGIDLGVGVGPAIGWYPLAPGEAWWPSYRASPRYVGGINFAINLTRYPRGYPDHYHRSHFHGVTVVREDDFRRGRHISEHWRRAQLANFNRGRIGFMPERPDFRDRRGDRDGRFPQPRLQSTPPRVERQFRRDQYVRPGQQMEPRRGQDRDDGRRGGWDRSDRNRAERDRGEPDRNERTERTERERGAAARADANRNDRDRNDRADRDRDRDRYRAERERGDRDRADRLRAEREREAGERAQRSQAQSPAVREQAQAQREQQRLQRDAQQAAREQQQDAARARQREERLGTPPPRSPVQMQPPPRQEAAAIGRQPAPAERPERAAERPQRGERPERAERAERGGRGDDGRGGRGQRGDDGPGRGARN